MLSARDATLRRGQFLLTGDFAAGPGELHALVGRNGAGKTSWLMLLAGRIAPVQGQVLCAGAPPAPPEVGFLPARAEDAVLGARRLHEVQMTLALRGEPGDPAEHLRALERVLDLPLEGGDSDGERFSRALIGLMAMRPKVLALDEPTSRLGPAARGVAYGALRRLQGEGLAVVCATHDPELARRADRIWLVSDGRVQPTSLRGAVGRGVLRPPEPSATFPAALAPEWDASRALRALLRP